MSYFFFRSYCCVFSDFAQYSTRQGTTRRLTPWWEKVKKDPLKHAQWKARHREIKRRYRQRQQQYLQQIDQLAKDPQI